MRELPTSGVAGDWRSPEWIRNQPNVTRIVGNTQHSGAAFRNRGSVCALLGDLVQPRVIDRRTVFGEDVSSAPKGIRSPIAILKVTAEL